MDNFIVNTGNIFGNIDQKATEQRPVGGQPSCTFSYVSTPKKKNGKYKYDVAISYASVQEHYVSRVCKILEKEHLVVFFAPNREEEFVGRDMITEFYDIYRYESMYVACFVSKEYLERDITMHEAKVAMLRQKEEKRNCLIPIYWGDARLSGLDPDINFLDADRLREVEVAERIKWIVNAFKKAGA